MIATITGHFGIDLTIWIIIVLMACAKLRA